MRRRTHAARTTRKSPKTSRAAPIAAKTDFHTESAPVAANIKAKPLLQHLKIGVDLMGNDNPPQALLKALELLSLPNEIQLVFIGTKEAGEAASRFHFVEAQDVIGMEEHPLLSLRRKKNSSMTVALRLLKEKKLDALISLGNTGALCSSAKMILSTLKGIARPALLTLMPTKKNPLVVLDVGANLQAKAQLLVQFARLGAAFQKTRGIQKPTVGLLNIGSEPLKGTSELRIAYNELQKEKQAFIFAGNIEGKTVFDGDVDVLVTDGFTGNVFLKTAEGIASLILDKIGPLSEMKKFQPLSYSEYPGALLLGVGGLVIKCHGYSSPKGVANAVLGAIELVKSRFVQKISNELS